ncbi:MAG TPA: D-2-hydroxyacid dehydrogenase [Ornithinimicrobium sp.]|uniref:D-2-hydroxyacid dehydrogenase n=1 Tax=Ornithinimicrobium sp. TaxID=1977084 RepID=UPI002B46B14B|nr:D-2-hydroxyacid dehydrogenase [Ornithinimicrobium sp.]HKJ12405.1 D-2-hydroxyacid dehydrogenase [Ornithinimicrobium sp.]
MNGRPRIVVLARHADDSPPHLERLQDRAEVTVTDASGLGEAMPGSQALFLWDFFSTALRDVWPRCGELEWVHVAAAGVDSLVFPELADSNVVVTNARGIFDRPIAEYVLGAVLAHAKQTHRSAELQRQHVWQHRETRTLRGATVAVVGTGAIGRECARVLSGLGMVVRGFGRTSRQGDPDFGEVLASSELAAHVDDVDYLVVAAPLTPQTRGLVDAEVLRALPATAHLVNIGRGESVVTEDLVEAVRSGGLDGASLDVMDPEPPPRDSPLWDLPGVHLTAHMSGDVTGWLEALALQFVDNAERWLDGSELGNVVDTRLGFVPVGAA